MSHDLRDRPVQIAIVLLCLCAPIRALALDDDVLLSSSDYAYLAAQGIERNDRVLIRMSPLELRNLHFLIVETRSPLEPERKAQEVIAVIRRSESQQQWEDANPGVPWKQPVQ